jgi:hypothetical protein
MWNTAGESAVESVAAGRSLLAGLKNGHRLPYPRTLAIGAADIVAVRGWRLACVQGRMRRFQIAAGIALPLAVSSLVGIANAPAILAQSRSEPAQWQTAAGGHLAFDVASVKLLKPGSGFRPPNFALDDGDGFMTAAAENPHGRLSVSAQHVIRAVA